MSITWQFRRRVRNQWPFLTVLAIVAVSFAYLLIWPDHWRRGSGIMAVGLLVAGVLRACLSGPHAGLLAVRGRWRDTVVYLALGTCILVVAIRLT